MQSGNGTRVKETRRGLGQLSLWQARFASWFFGCRCGRASVFLALLAVPLPGPEQVEVRTVEEGIVRGEFRNMDAESVVILADGMQRSLPNHSVLSIRWPGRVRRKSRVKALAEFVNGDLLLGKISGGNGDELRMEFGRSGETQSVGLPIDSLRRIVNPNNSGGLSLTAFQTNGESDRIYRVSGDSADFMDGTIEGFERGEVQFESVLGRKSFPLGDIAGAVLTPIEEYQEKPQLLAVLDLLESSGRLQAGTRLTGTVLGVAEGKLRFRGELIGEIAVDLREIFAIRIKNGNFTYLSDLVPKEVIEKTPFGDEGSISFPYQKDRSVGGKALRVNGVEFFRGLGVHSYSRLVYSLDQKYQFFRTKIGMDDEVLSLGAKGSVIFRIYLDDNKVFESSIMRGGMDPSSVPQIALGEAKELALEVDYADNFHIADRANWLESILIP